jgi:hypothetical protein
MGRLVGLDYFFSQEAFTEEKADASEIRRVRGLALDSDGSNPGVTDCQRLIAMKMQRHFDNRILRRTASSLDWKKNALITLPPYEEFVVVVKPTVREMKIISELADRVKER